jgi:Lrp/AsnC family transcriptional regulator, leucine-responsive regulatory protein
VVKNSNDAQLDAAQSARLDDIDRKLLGLLAADATRSYNDLGKLVHLSLPPQYMSV